MSEKLLKDLFFKEYYFSDFYLFQCRIREVPEQASVWAFVTGQLHCTFCDQRKRKIYRERYNTSLGCG